MKLHDMIIATLVMIASTGVQAECDIDAGKKVFNKCMACHSLEPGQHLMGPSLYGLMGRPVGSAEGYLYSKAMEDADFTWNEDTVSAFLENPALNMPGTVMPFAGLKKPEQRLAINCLLNNS